MELHYIARNELSKFWETKSICIEFADGPMHWRRRMVIP